MKVPIKPDTIFVSIASYRDDVVLTTLKSMFENANNPKNVFAGICQQNKPEDQDAQVGNENNCNIRTIRIPNYEAQGPTYARYLCSTLWNGEEYFLQIDSHIKFVKDWDVKCIKMIKDIKEKGLSKKPILSHYTREISDHSNYNEEKDKHQVPTMCKAFWNTRDMISFLGAEVMDTKGEPRMTPYMAAGFVFSHSDLLQEVPFDPKLPYLFVGEEILHSIRAYTHGWDMFTPTENIVFHEYTRADKPKIWTDNPYYSDMPAFDKVRYYIGLDKDDSKITPDLKINLDKYGLGKVRSLDDYYKYSGIDKDKKEVTTNFCRPDNKATEEDIKQSNEKNHVKENFKFFDPASYTVWDILLIIIILIAVIIFIAWIIKSINVKVALNK